MRPPPAGTSPGGSSPSWRPPQLLAHEPALAETLGPDTTAPWTPVEQDQLPDAATLEELLHQLAWPEAVVGAALVVERVMLPADVEGDLPEDQVEILRAIAEHPQRQEMRLAVAVLRDGGTRLRPALPQPRRRAVRALRGRPGAAAHRRADRDLRRLSGRPATYAPAPRRRAVRLDHEDGPSGTGAVPS